ncbi:SAV_2336 N-terminal domain-related protein [Streptomyces marokkonensis]|uniref:SAV_2336 N-terminal domain-related protein n=1 Tax=Streptomyces marokkonensis TaxID=324855 RepID=A0ABW6Q125_9ACTN
MPSDPPPEGSGPPHPLTRLADVLTEAAGGLRPTPLELAELLWLARTLDQEPSGTAPRPPPPEPAPSEPPPRTAPAAPPPPAPPAPPSDPPRAPLHLPSPDPSLCLTDEPHAALLAPAPPMLRRSLALQRSLRPLKRRVDAPMGRELDEGATADRIARLGAAPDWWLPVTRPTQERWLRLTLVHDTGPTMPVWRPLVRELHTALAQSGIFRTVTLLSAGPDGTVRGPGAHAPADGRSVTLVISDCMGPQWRRGGAGDLWHGTLRRWSHRMPVAVVQPLPEHLWSDTALPTTPGRLSAPHPAAPAATLTFTPYDTSDRANRHARDRMLPLPVLEPAPDWLSNWARLIASPGGTEFPAAVADLRSPFLADAGSRADLGRLTPEDLVLRFRGTASREAFRLACHLALGRPDLPVMRLVQAAIEHDPRPRHLAEVILSGMLTTAPGPPGSYAFRPGVRQLLLRGLPRSARQDTTALLHRLGALIDDRAGRAPGDFRASVPDRSGTTTAVEGEAFAAVSPDSARRLTGGAVTTPGPGRPPAPRLVGGRYRLVRRLTPSGNVWQAEDTETNRTVVVRLHETATGPDRREAFLRDARLLGELGHRNVTRIHDAGIDGDVPYVVMEHLDGVTLNSLAAPNGYRLPAPLLVSVGAQLAHGLTAVHEAGLAHGELGLSRVVLLPDGTVKLSLFEPGRTSDRARSEDLRALCELLLVLTWGTSRLTVPIDPRHLDHLPRDLRETYAHAFDLLMSPAPATQIRGRDLLLDPELPRRAAAAYERRSYRILGPFGVVAGGSSPDLGPNERAMLAMLVLKHGRTVTHDELKWGLWNAREEPRDVMAVLGATASGLRQALGPGVLGTLSHGFVLHTSADHVDLVECDHLVRRAEEARRRDDLHEARSLVSEALGLWHGDDPLADVPGPAARTARTRLVRLRLDLRRQRAELDLDLGEPERASADLDDLVRAHPSREDLLRLHLVALRRQGRIEEALAAYEDYELAGGAHPELLALGHELRGALGDPPDAHDQAYPSDAPAYDPLAAPDELPEGTYPAWDPTSTASPAPLGDPPPYESRPTGVPPEARPPASGDEDPAAPAGPRPAHQTGARTRLFFDWADGPEHPDTVAALGRAVTRLLTDSGVPARECELYALAQGYSLLVPAGPHSGSVLRALMAGFTHLVEEMAGPRVVVAVWRTRDGQRVETPPHWAVREVLNSSAAHGIIALAPSLREELDEQGEATASWERLGTEPVTGWYRLAFRDPGRPRLPSRGPYPMLPGARLPEPQGVERAVVYSRGDQPLGSARVPGADHYYEVDLTERRTALEERGPALTHGSVALVRGEAVWRVSDPAALVGEGPRDVDGFLRRHVVAQLRDVADRLNGAGRDRLRQALLDRLGPHDVPGCTVRWDLTVSAAPTASAAHTAHRTRVTGTGPADVLLGADAVILGFDGTLTTLFDEFRAAEVAEDLARLAVGGWDALEDDITPVELLRELADHPSVEELRVQLNRYESAAAHTARPAPLSIELVHALADRQLRLAVVTDHSTDAAETFLDHVRVAPYLRGGVHGRPADLALLMPHPDVVHRALRRLGTVPARCVMIGSTTTESAAAGAAGVPFIGCRHTDGILRSSGPASLTVPGLGPLLAVVRSVPPR